MTIFFKIVCFIFVSTISFSQSIVVIDKNKVTESLFDDTKPLSFISMLKSGLYNLGSFVLEGMDDALLNSLSKEEKDETLKFAPMFQDYEIDENGEQLTVFNSETGMYDFVFIPPDTTYASLDNIERIVFNIGDGNLLKVSRIESVEFWKRYGGKLYKVLSLDPTILELQGFKTIRPVQDDIQSQWLDKMDPKSLWNQMREASLKVKSNFDEGIVDIEEKGFVMDFFPYNPDFPFDAYSGGTPVLVEDQIINESNYLVVLNQDFNTNLPFQFSYGDSLSSQLNYHEKLKREFDELNFIQLDSEYPLIDMDPDSPNFLNELMIENSEGIMEYVYPDPVIVYVWCDYNDIQLYAVEEFVFDGRTDEMRTKIVGLCLAKKSMNGKPEIVSSTKVEGQIASFFEDYPSDKLDELDWNIIFKEELEKKANGYDLTNTKDVKRLNKRNSKLGY